MTGHGCFKKTLEAPSWMCSLDIQDAYLHIPIAKHLHRYLAFTAMGKLYFFRALPFGLAPAPWLFTRLLDFVIKGFQRQGHKVLAYLDDLIIWNTCPSTTASSAKYIQTQLEFLGFRINLEKSSLVPRQELTWLGISWDSRTGSCVLPLQKRQEIASVATKLFLSPLVSRRQWERFTGLVTFAAQVSAQAKLRSHEVACHQRIALPEQRDVPHLLPKSLRAVLSDWMHPSFLDIPDRLYLAPPSLTIWTDASLSGWGVYSSRGHLFQGSWHPVPSVSINVLEVRAIFLALKKIPQLPKSVLVFCDNSAAVATVNKLGSRSSALQSVARCEFPDLWRRGFLV